MIRSSCIIETYDKHARVQCACAYGSSNVSMTSCSAIRNLRGLLLWSTTQTYKKKTMHARTLNARISKTNKSAHDPFDGAKHCAEKRKTEK